MKVKRKITIRKLLGIVFFITPPLFLIFGVFVSMEFENNPSSTSGIAYITTPIIGLFLALFFGLIGDVTGKIVESRSKNKSVSIHKFYKVIIIAGVVAVLSGGFTGYVTVWAWNKKAEPRVIVTNNNIEKSSVESFEGLDVPGWKFADNRIARKDVREELVAWLQDNNITIKSDVKKSVWNQDTVYLCYDRSRAYLIVQDSEIEFRILQKQNIKNLTYITNVKGIEIEFNNKKCFALLTVLRATLRKSYLTIYSPEQEILYQELTGRIRTIASAKLNEKEYLITGSEQFPQFVYNWKSNF